MGSKRTPLTVMQRMHIVNTQNQNHIHLTPIRDLVLFAESEDHIECKNIRALWQLNEGEFS